MNKLQKQKAVEALEKQKTEERKKNHALIYRLGAYTKLHYEGVLLPYRVLYDLEKAEHEKTFTEIPPNPYYPHPAITLKTKDSFPRYEGDFNSLPKDKDGLPILKSDPEYMRKIEEYEQRKKAEKMSIDDWGYYYARFLLPYDLSSFTDFDWLGTMPKDERERNIIDGLKAACMEAQADCRENPDKYNLEIPRLEEHKTIYDVWYGYI